MFDTKKYYPTLSVIVPSYNQGAYIEETLLSIINQRHPSLELIVIDGGSTDNSVEIIKKYESYITYWVSEKDKGQSHAINKGLAKATGEWIAWLNSDDCYIDGALDYIFNSIDTTQYDFLYGYCFVGESTDKKVEHIHPVHAKEKLKDILQFFYHVSYIIPSQSVFIRKEIIDTVGLLDEALHYCMDLDWFCRIYIATERRFHYTKAICFYRVNETTKTSTQKIAMKQEAIAVAEKYYSYLSTTESQKLKRLIQYYKSLLVCMQNNKLLLLQLIIIFIKFPYHSTRDITYTTMLKSLL
jgi:glycosyltransferase involved in cell wall biosynthesis